eukprot:scaffold315933_cov17-Tisochrysis_lutea.AAC.1
MKDSVFKALGAHSVHAPLDAPLGTLVTITSGSNKLSCIIVLLKSATGLLNPLPNPPEGAWGPTHSQTTEPGAQVRYPCTIIRREGALFMAMLLRSIKVVAHAQGRSMSAQDDQRAWVLSDSRQKPILASLAEQVLVDHRRGCLPFSGPPLVQPLLLPSYLRIQA